MNTAVHVGERRKRPESPGRDFPYYAGDPVEVSGRGWLVVLVALGLAFAQLELLPLKTFPLDFIPTLLFTGLPLLAVMAVTGGRAPALFRPMGFKGFFTGLGFGVLTIVSSMIAGLLLTRIMELSSNTAVADLAAAGVADLLLFLARTFIQLIGEELITILPLLAILWLCVSRFGMSRRWALALAVIVSTLLFAALHLPTYNWNVVQCLGTIGTARLVLTMAYIVTRNLWVSATAHIANDWSLFLMSFAGGHMPIGTDDPI
ncbi:CPBP family intramembrane glutamic endopeptidase [Brevundimonas sp. PWP3-1b1]|uniref:CPBP family intramembrane glutamic endopeptidase n=1 Tax=unclassified Brevundimonas TaxID=2622653 RepID=UPI003CF6DA0A